MNITFLLGNGFDVNLGLKTTYKEFYPTYFNTNEKLPDDNCIKKFCKTIKDEYEDWSDFEWAFSQCADGTYNDIGEILANFDDLFASYLKEECKKCNYSSPNILSEFKKFIYTPYSFLERADYQYVENFFRMHRSESQNYNFISFNYTDTLDCLLSSEFKKTFLTRNSNGYEYIYNPVLHIHGSIKEGYIIVGIDSLEQFKNENLKINQKLKRHCVKEIINNQNGYSEKENKYKSIIENSNVICVYGMSFGESDRRRWSIISSWLRKNKNNKLIIFKYNPGFAKLNRMSKGLLLDAIDSARDEYLEILGFKNKEYESMYNQIFVADSALALNFKLINEEELIVT